MKTVFSNNELAHIWAAQSQNEGRANSFFFNGKTIYSYGHHFPIATIEGNFVFFTKRTYSNTTAKHISLTRRAISHKKIIYCYDVPTNLKYASTDHENNQNRWKKEIKALFDELGNKKIRNTQDRINSINSLISELNIYCDYFSLKIKDKELKSLLLLATDADFLAKAREAKEKQQLATEKKLKQATKVFDKYIKLWRENKLEDISNFSAKEKELFTFYQNNSQSYTRLRYNSDQNRVETSKGVQIPVEIAKRAFLQLNSCMESTCNKLSIPVLNYTITETNKTAIIAGCHTIPKEDVRYIATLLNWN